MVTFVPPVGSIDDLQQKASEYSEGFAAKCKFEDYKHHGPKSKKIDTYSTIYQTYLSGGESVNYNYNEKNEDEQGDKYILYVFPIFLKNGDVKFVNGYCFTKDVILVSTYDWNEIIYPLLQSDYLDSFKENKAPDYLKGVYLRNKVNEFNQIIDENIDIGEYFYFFLCEKISLFQPMGVITETFIKNPRKQDGLFLGFMGSCSDKKYDSKNDKLIKLRECIHCYFYKGKLYCPIHSLYKKKYILESTRKNCDHKMKNYYANTDTVDYPYTVTCARDDCDYINHEVKELDEKDCVLSTSWIIRGHKDCRLDEDPNGSCDILMKNPNKGMIECKYAKCNRRNCKYLHANKEEDKFLEEYIPRRKPRKCCRKRNADCDRKTCQYVHMKDDKHLGKICCKYMNSKCNNLKKSPPACPYIHLKNDEHLMN